MNPLRPVRWHTGLCLALVALISGTAAPVLPPWTPLFKGVDYLTAASDTPADVNFPTLQAAHALRIDLRDPDVKLLTTPRIASYQQGVHETAAMTVSSFLQAHKLQAAINANFYTPADVSDAGHQLAVNGLLISQGVVVSPQTTAENSAAIVFDKTNIPTVIHVNFPATSNIGLYTAISGDYSLVVKGVNISHKYANLGGIHNVNPRTAFGISQDHRYLYLLTIDGRQAGYSEGAYDYETAGWLLLLGAYDAVNLDGGGSTTLVAANSAGVPVELNKSSYVAAYGRERLIGGHFGISAKPVPGFINDVTAVPDDDAATITWSTIAPASSQVEYGLADTLGLTSAIQNTTVNNHAVLLTNLQPATGYFYRAVSLVNGTRYASSNFFFTTTNYVTTNQVIEVTHSWKFTTANLDGKAWAAPAYNDTAWSGPGAGLLWVDIRDPAVQPAGVEPKNTPMPANPVTSYPYTTYYFRTHFFLPTRTPDASLQFSTYLDDGAVLYLNGQEIERIRLAPAPAVILNSTLANAFGCTGDATCSDDFTLSAAAAARLVAGDNLLAVEVHNYSSRSPDITFGLALGILESVPAPLELTIGQPDGKTTLSWTRGGFTLQQADSLTGPWSDVPGPVISSPFVPTRTATVRYYRLRK